MIPSTLKAQRAGRSQLSETKANGPGKMAPYPTKAQRANRWPRLLERTVRWDVTVPAVFSHQEIVIALPASQTNCADFI
jgi:hypothetical protein